jgi:glycosyltransferase involved in cell wall biosynthesis
MTTRILYATSKPGLFGGGQKSLLLILKHLDRSRFTPLLLCPSDGPLVDHAGELGLRTIVLPLPALARMGLGELRRLTRLIRNEGIDLIHTDSPRQTVYLGLAGRLARVPLVWHVRVVEPEPYLFERLLYRLSTRVIAVSQAAAGRFSTMPRFSQKVAVIHNAVDFAEYAQVTPQSPQSTGTPSWTRIGMVGRIEAVKGIDDFLRAAAQVHRSQPDARFCLVGDGEEAYLRHVKRLVEELGIADVVEYPGYLDDIRPLLSSLTLLVNASKMIGRRGGEGLPRAVVEAMALGKPVVASDVGGNPEAVTHGLTGMIVPAGNPDALAKAVTALLSDRARMDRMGANGQARAREMFDVKAQMTKIESLYEGLLAGAK